MSGVCSAAGVRGARLGLAGAVTGALLLAAGVLPAAGAGIADAGAQPVELAAPYEYLGWGDPQPPAEVIESSGLHDLTLAFILARKGCTPAWDGHRPLLGGVDQSAIESIRASGAEVDVSFGGWTGKKLGSTCKTASALAGAYQQVIDAYSLRAIDIDIEHNEIKSKKVRQRVVEALALVRAANPGLQISITFPSSQGGPEATGRSLIADAAAIGFMPDAWTIMPFDFGKPAGSMGEASVQALEALDAQLVSAYAISPSAAYEHAGISSMNGDTDEASETVTLEDFSAILSFARRQQLARVSFWAVNRDRPCSGRGSREEDCSGISQAPYAFSELLAGYEG